LSSRTPCQCTLLGRSIRLWKRTVMVAPRGTRMSGPGDWPLKP